jgi:iron uptake system EfeUOB component EfeO/EfeM
LGIGKMMRQLLAKHRAPLIKLHFAKANSSDEEGNALPELTAELSTTICKEVDTVVTSFAGEFTSALHSLQREAWNSIRETVQDLVTNISPLSESDLAENIANALKEWGTFLNYWSRKSDPASKTLLTTKHRAPNPPPEAALVVESLTKRAKPPTQKVVKQEEAKSVV